MLQNLKQRVHTFSSEQTIIILDDYCEVFHDHPV